MPCVPPFPSLATQLCVVNRERAEQPARIDAHDDHEQLECQQQVDRLQNVDDGLRGTTIEIVDIQDDSIHPLAAGQQGLVAEPFGQGFEVPPHERDQPEVLAIIVRAGAIGEKSRQAAGGYEAVQARFGFEHAFRRRRQARLRLRARSHAVVRLPPRDFFLPRR